MRIKTEGPEREVESVEEDSDFECYNKDDGKPLHVDVDKEVIEGGPTLALLPNRSEGDKINNIGETMGGNGNNSVRRSNRIYKTSKWLGSAPCFLKITFSLCRTNPKRTTKTQTVDNRRY